MVDVSINTYLCISAPIYSVAQCVHVTLDHTIAITLWCTLSAVAVVHSESLTHWA